MVAGRGWVLLGDLLTLFNPIHYCRLESAACMMPRVTVMVGLSHKSDVFEAEL